MSLVAKESPEYRIIEHELRMLARVVSALSQLSTDNPGTPDYDEAMISLRDQIGEAKPEDIAALVEQMTRIAAIAQRYGKGRDLPIDPQSPYFAHMRLEEDERQRDVLIGKRGFIDRERNVQIVDWRNAPISRIYYRYEEGDDYDEQFGNRYLEGVILSRRNLTIDEAVLRRIGSPQGTFFLDDEDNWQQSAATMLHKLSGGQGKALRPPAPMRRGDKKSQLGSGRRMKADKHLPEIAALIDPTQFELITHPDSGLVVLQGGAGTGKTTVALHRVAYLNFNQPKRFRPEKILLIVLSEAMVRYVERVLPSLDVRGIHVMTAQTWLQRTRNRTVPQAPRSYNDDTPSEVLRFKKHPLLIKVLEDYVSRQAENFTGRFENAIEGRPEADRLLRHWRGIRNEPIGRRCSIMRDWLYQQGNLPTVTRQQAEGILRKLNQRAFDLVSDWAEILTDHDLLRGAVDKYAKGAFSSHEINRVHRWCTRQNDEVDPDADEAAAATQEQEDERQRKRSRPRIAATDSPFMAIDGQDVRQQGVAGKLDHPDDALLLYLCQLKFGGLQGRQGKPIRYAHMVADEAQDLSAIELKLLIDTTGKQRSVTLAGDVAQRLVFDNQFSTWEELLDTLGIHASSNATLKLGYRSTGEVMALANSLLGDLATQEGPQATRHGAPVELICFQHQGEAIEMLASSLRSLVAREPLASVTVIARYAAQARAYAEALRNAEVAGVRLVHDQEFSFKPGIEVTTVADVKGLEFDYVILVDVSNSTYPDTLESRHLLHIGATRAAHQLWLLAVGKPSPLVPKHLATQ